MAFKGSQLLFRSSGLAVVGLAAITCPAIAYAEGRPIAFTFEQTEDYGRIVATWKSSDENAPKITTSMIGPVLILKFEEPVNFDPEELQTGLPRHIAVARLSEDGREARIALSREFRIHQSNSYDLAGIDLVNPDVATDPADIVSPLAAQRLREAAEAAAAAEAARLAALPKPLPVQLRASEAGDFSTLAFYWPEEITYEEKIIGNTLELTFSRRGEADLAPVRVAPPTGMDTITAENSDANWIARIELRDGYWASPLLVDSAVLVRFREGEKPESPVEEDAVLPLALQQLAEALPEPEAEADNPAETGIAPPSRKPPPVQLANATPGTEPKSLLPAASPDLDSQPMAIVAPVTQRRLWNEALDGLGKAHVTMTPHGRGIDIDIAFRSEIPAAVFRHNHAVWIAFPASGEFDLSDMAPGSGIRIDQVRSAEGMALRVFAANGDLISLTNSGRLWSISVGSKGELASYQISPKRTASSGGSGIVVDVPDAGTVFELENPDVGEKLIIVPVKTHTRSIDRSLRFVEASIPVTAQGMVVIPHADDLKVIQRGEQILFSRDSGLMISNWGVDTQLAMNNSLSPGFLDFDGWKRGGPGDFWYNLKELDRAAALAEPEDWAGQGALMDLARFYLAWELAPESYGPLKLVEVADPVIRQDAQWLVLQGAADIMNGRYKSALEMLNRSSVRSDSSVAAWRGYAHAELGDWRKAREAFVMAEPMIDAFIPLWAGRFHAAAARANVRVGDGAAAERHAEAAKRTGDAETIGQVNLTLGELALAAGRENDAATIYTRLLDHQDANIRVRAELASILLARKRGEMSALDASDRLDTLRFRWRGDALELEIVQALIDNLFELGQYRESLSLAQSVSMQFPDLPGARQLRITMMEQFEALFLDGKADNTDPIIALALFYEFRDLTPIGPDGDRMIRKLANRLVAFDLLDPATELLAHQVENRNLIGSGRSKIAADLAAIYLLDNRPEEALRTIASTRQTGLDAELRLERRLLEAAAHMELKRFGHAIELVNGLEDQRALDLLAEVHWRARTWGAAGRALQRTLPEPGMALSIQQSRTALRAAVAYRLDGDYDGLSQLRRDYLNVMKDTTQAESFDLLTGQAEVSTTRLTDTVRQLADTTTADAFIKNLKQRFGDAGGLQ